jgi:hypothetical protein
MEGNDMNTTVDRIDNGIDATKIAYIRAVNTREISELPNEALEAVEDLESLFVLTNGEGKKLAIVEGREAAIATAEANALMPVSVH